MEKDYTKIYCKFDNNKQSIDKVISKMFNDYITNKHTDLENKQDEHNK